MKKITLVIFTAFLTLNCSKDDSFNAEETHSFSSVNSTTLSKKSEINYAIVDGDFKAIGEMSIYHDETSIYMICKTNSGSYISEAGLYFGTFSKIPKPDDQAENNTYTQYHKLESLQAENIFRLEKKDLQFDKNGCVYVTTHFKVTNSTAKDLKSAVSLSQILPGSEKLTYFLYCIK